MRMRAALSLPLALFLLVASAPADDPPKLDTARGDRIIARYFARETEEVADRCLADVETLEDWTSRRDEYRRQLFEMLGLDPLPERTPLEVTYTGRTDHAEFTVKKLHYQSRPGLYVTGNLYLPKEIKEPLPAILYVCGHGRVKENGVSYGNKVHYQHHGAWFARHGYVCLTIDTLQLGEIEGLHHGTYNHGLWWWNARGYSPAGVEAWNCIRALDLLESLEEVDGERLGVTGRSGGGAYSWWIAALDERIKAAVPVAGITDLTNHVVDGTVEGHCDCMFMVNTYRWDYPQVAALIAPRPLLISNSDKDGIFPLDGVVRTHALVRKIYRLYDAADKLGLQITEGPHRDTQELRVHAFHWFNRFLKGEQPLIDTPAEKFFAPKELKVFEELPGDERNTEISETFTARAPEPEVPETPRDYSARKVELRDALDAKCFRGWPRDLEALDLKAAFDAHRRGVRLRAYDFTSQGPIRLRLYVASRPGLEQPSLVVLNALDPQGWQEFLATYRPAFEKELAGETLPAADAESFGQHQQMFKSFDWAMAYFAPRGVGPTAWDQSERKQTQIRRRFMLLGQTLDGMQVWDIRRAARALRQVDELANVPLWMQGHRTMAGNVLYASLYVPRVTRLDLHQLPASHREGPIYLNILRYLDVPQAVALAAEHTQVRIYEPEETDRWDYPVAVAKKLGWPKKQIDVRVLQQENGDEAE